MTQKCCAKPNVITYEDGTGLCRSCGTTFNGGEATPAGTTSSEELGALRLEVESLQGNVIELKRQLDEYRDHVASLEQRVLALEGQSGSPS